jgi:hypothetical protein
MIARPQHLIAGDGARDLLHERRGATSLHSTTQSDIIRAALQMMNVCRGVRRVSSRLALLILISGPFPSSVRADDDPAENARPPGETFDPGTTREEIMQALQEVARTYGHDAVLLEGHLLQLAIRSGSVREATVSVPGVEERDGKRFVAFKLETGIVYNDREVSPPSRAVRVWSDIVEATLRKFHSLSVSADGIAFLVSYEHKAYIDESDLRAHLSEDRGESESAVFYLSLSDIRELLAEQIAAQQLIDRSTILVNAAPAHLVLAEPTPHPSAANP